MNVFDLPMADVANEISRGFSSGNSPGSTWLAGLLMGVCGLTVVGLVLHRIYLLAAATRTPQAQLNREVCQTLGLGRGDMRKLHRIARQIDIASPVTLLLSPTLLQRVRDRLAGRDVLLVDRILLTLAD